MEYFEFLLQKEGDRTWLPIKSPKIQLEAGRYRVVAQSSRNNTDVEICVTHSSTEEVPPKRRSQKRSRRTNPEGLMVVIPFTYLKPGLWELTCGGDIMSDFLGNSWQQVVHLQVLPKATEVLEQSAPPIGDASQAHFQVDSSASLDSSNSELESALREIEASALTPLATSAACNPEVPPENETTVVESQTAPATLTDTPASTLPQIETLPENETTVAEVQAAPATLTDTPASTLSQIETLPENEATAAEVQPVPATLCDIPASTLPQTETPAGNEATVAEADAAPITQTTIGVPFEPTESDQNLVALTDNSAELAAPINPILDQSLQMLEQILQQVLEPVLQDFEPPESQEPQELVTFESELPSEIDSNLPGLILTLEEEALVARRGEPLTITGQVDLLDVNQLTGSATVGAASNLNSVFRGTLHYELRDPQTSQLLLDVQQPLPEQTLPLAFNHTLEIPPDCKTRLVLGKATLYGSTSNALASQPFSVTADLDELLGAIIPGTKVMPVAKMLVLANNPAALEEKEDESPETASLPLEQVVLDLIDTRQSHHLPLQPATRQPLPPQIYQASPNPKTTKSLQLPNLPKMRSVDMVDSATISPTPDEVEVKQEDLREQLPPFILADDFSADLPNRESANTAEDTVPELQLQEAVQHLEEVTLQEDSVLAANASTNVLDVTESSDSPASVPNSGVSTSVTLETLEHSQLTVDSPLGTSEAIDTSDWVTPDANSPNGDLEATESPDASPEMQSLEVSVAGSVADEPTAVDNAFQSLKLQDRFWLRLNSLAADANLSQWLKSEISPSSSQDNQVEGTDEEQTSEPVVVEVEDVTQQQNPETLLVNFDESIWGEETDELDSSTNDTTLQQPPELEENTSQPMELPVQLPLVGVTNTNWTTQEIVVEEDEDLPPPKQVPASEPFVEKLDTYGIDYRSEPLNLQPHPRSLSPLKWESPLPAPSLFVPTNELAVGEPVTVRVKLPPHQARLCIKLWAIDRQSRSLLDGPRWLVDLLPDGAGEMEAMSQLIVPFGSVEIRFEAIAVDLDSQRESHKVSVDCVVVPSDLPNLSLDEFEA